MNSYSGGEIISNDKNIYITNPECKEGSKKYEVVVTKFNQRETYMLKINCLEMVDYGYYKCYIQIRGDSSASWPSKIGYLVVQGERYIVIDCVKVYRYTVESAYKEPAYKELPVLRNWFSFPNLYQRN